MRIVAVLSFVSAMTVAASWATAGAMTAEQRAEICDISIIQGMERLNGKPHDRDECIQNPNAYLKKIMGGNQAISAEIVKKKQAVQSAPVKITIDAQQACKAAIIKQARFPSEADFSYWGSKKWRVNEHKTIMKGEVKLMNGIGNMIPHIYHCEFFRDAVTKAEIFLP